jgi:hypothetical protein
MMRKAGEEGTHGDAVDGDEDAAVGGGKAWRLLSRVAA